MFVLIESIISHEDSHNPKFYCENVLKMHTTLHDKQNPTKYILHMKHFVGHKQEEMFSFVIRHEFWYEMCGFLNNI